MLKDIILGILIIAVGLWFIYQSAKEYDEYQMLIQKKELDNDDRIEIKYLLTFFLKSVTIGLICIIGGMMVLLGIWL